MSSFLKRGKREQVRKDKKELKQRTKDFYKILGTLDDVAKLIDYKYKDSKERVVHEDSIVELAAEFTDREIGSMEKFILLGKLEQLGFKDLRNKNED